MPCEVCEKIELEIIAEEDDITLDVDFAGEFISGATGEEYQKGYDEGYDEGYAEGEEVGYEKGYEAGLTVMPAEYSWAKYTTGRPLFADDSWATENTVICAPNVNSFAELFYNLKLTRIKTLTLKSDVPIINVNYCLRTQNAESYAVLLRIILECDFSQCNNFNQFLQFQRKLVSIEGQPLDLSGATSFSLNYLVALESFRVVANSIKGNFRVAESSNLDEDTIQSVIDGLADLTGGTAQTLTVHAGVKSRIEANTVWLATIVSKNWNLA